jgi:hypothetical protein
MNKTLLAAAAVTLFATSTPICAQQMTTKQQLIGTWTVVTLGRFAFESRQISRDPPTRSASPSLAAVMRS